MIKKLVLILVPLLGIGIILYVKKQMDLHPSDIHNLEKHPLEFKDNKVQCPQCYMYLVGKKHTAQVIDTNHKTHFFDDPGCVILWVRDQKIDLDSLKLWVYTMDTQEYIDMRKAFYAISDITPMEYGFAAYKQAKEGFIDFEEMKLRMLRGENMSNPKVKKRLLGE